jgi:glycosyltransferase 2 family protein
MSRNEETIGGQAETDGDVSSAKLHARGFVRTALTGMLLAVVVYGGLLMYGDLSSVSAGIASIGPANWCLIVVLSTLNYVLRLVRWNVYLRVLDVRIPARHSALVFFSGFAMSITPGKLGEVLKSLLLRESHRIPVSRTAPIVVAERVTDLLGLVAMMAIGSLSLPGGLVITALSGALVVALVALSSSRRIGSLAVSFMERLPVVRRVAPTFARLHGSLLELSGPRTTTIATLLSTVAWLAHGACLYAVVEASTDAHISMEGALFSYAAPLLASTLALLPGGLGLAEASMASSLRELGGPAMTTAAAATVTMVVRLITFWWAVVLGVLALAVLRTKRVAGAAQPLWTGEALSGVLDLWRKSSLAVLSVAGVTLLVASLFWPIQHDAPLLLYPAWLAWSGLRVPYTQIFDLNQPLSYLVYGAIGTMTGYSDALLRVVDLSCTAFSLGLGALLLPRSRRLAAVWGGALFVVWISYHRGQDALQRESFVLLFVLLAAVSSLRTPRPVAAVLVGLLCGCAALIKPHSALAFVWIATFMALEVPERRSYGAYAQIASGFVAGCAVPLAIAVRWLTQHGAFDAWHSLLTDYLPLYGAMSGDHEVLAGLARLVAVGKGLGRASLIAVVAVAAAHTSSRLRGESGWSREFRLIAGLTMACALYPTASGQFWRYHLLPLCFFAALLFGVAFLETWPAKSSRGAAIAQALVMVFCLRTYAWGTAYSFGTQGTENRTSRIGAMVDYLAPRLRPGDTVQPLDWTAGAVAAMLRLRVPIATDFLYDFHFYHHASHPFISALRRRFMVQFTHSQPRFVIQVYNDSKPWPRGTDTTRSFPALEQELRAHYDEALRTSEFRILARRDSLDSATRPGPPK